MANVYPDRTLPDTEITDEQIKLAAETNPAIKSLLPNLGRRRPYNSTKAREVLGIDFISAEDALLASAESAFKLGLV